MKILFGMRDDGDMTEPMNIMLLSALAKGLGHKTALWVMERDDPRETISRERPDLVAFSCITGSHGYYIEGGKRVKEIDSGIKTVFGGPHLTFFPGEIFKHQSIDMMCVGEGDDAWPELLRALENNEPPEDIPNMVTRNNAQAVLEISSPGFVQIKGTTRQNGGSELFDQYALSRGCIRPRKTDLDSLPFMDRGLIYDNTEFKYRYKRTMMASRGCPFRCTYCFERQSHLLYKGLGKIRRWYSVDRFLDELEFIKRNWDTRFFKFYDDIFPPLPCPEEIAWHEEFCSKYPERIGLPFHILTRCDMVTAMERKGVNLIQDWKGAGLASVTMSIESGNSFIRDHIMVRDMGTQDIVEAFKMAYNAGVPTFPNTIVGVPAPIIPQPEDPDFDRKIARVGEELAILQKINGAKTDFKQVSNLIRNWLPNESCSRLLIVSILRALGLRQSHLEYNMESVDFTLNQRPGFAEFPTLFPYPKTGITAWCIARGDFDGNYEKLHASYQTESPLSCYSKREKSIIQNLTLLGAFLTLFTGSKNRLMQFLGKPLQKLCVHRLSRITHPLAAKLYLWLYTVSKAYMHRARVYPIKYSLREKIRFYGQMFQLDFWKQEKKRKKFL